MKKGIKIFSLIVLIAMLINNGLIAQNKSSVVKGVDYWERAKSNMKYLAKDTSIYNFVRMTHKGVYMFAEDITKIPQHQWRPEIVIYWKEVPHFLDELYNYDYYESLEFYNTKGADELVLPEKYSWDFYDIHENFPEGWGGGDDEEGAESALRISIDPGHMAGSFSLAVLEEKYLKVKGSEIGETRDQMIYEAELNYACAKLLAYKIDSAGGEAFITREHGASAVGKPFESWYAQDFVYDVEHYVAQGDLTKERAEWLLKTATRKEIFQSLYKYIDFTERVRRINYFRPDLTLIMHFNSKESNDRDEHKFTKLVDDNYSMGFVPGAFMKRELKNQSARIEFLRLLLSRDLEESIRVGELYLSRVKNDLNVNQIPVENELRHIERACLETGVQGLYSRNLALTRLVRSPLVYCETFLQDNKDEFAALVKGDYRHKNIVTSKRIAEVAEMYFQLINDWLEDNRKLNKKNVKG